LSLVEQDQIKEKQEELTETETWKTLEEKDKFNKNCKCKSSHPKDLIIGKIEEEIHTRSKEKED